MKRRSQGMTEEEKKQTGVRVDILVKKVKLEKEISQLTDIINGRENQQFNKIVTRQEQKENDVFNHELDQKKNKLKQTLELEKYYSEDEARSRNHLIRLHEQWRRNREAAEAKERQRRERNRIISRERAAKRRRLHGLTDERIARFVHFPADATFVGQKCCCCWDEYEVGRNLVRLDCNHEMCLKCMKWFKSNKTCPICRHQFGN